MSVAAESETTKNIERVIVGRVVSNKMDKTIVVLIQRKVRHPKYNKYISRSTKLYVHDEDNICKEGDTVMVTACRPISKNKFWRVVKVVE